MRKERVPNGWGLLVKGPASRRPFHEERRNYIGTKEITTEEMGVNGPDSSNPIRSIIAVEGLSEARGEGLYIEKKSFHNGLTSKKELKLIR